MRAVSFLPFFIFGTIWKEIGLKPTKKYLWLCLTIICIIFISVQDLFDENVLYGVTGDPMQRIIFYSVAFTWIIFLMVWMPNREISKTVSRIGQNTLPVFLFHGLIIKTVFTFINPEFGLFNMVICIVSSLLLCVVLAQEKLTNLLLLKRK